MARKCGAKIVQLSTDDVFDGKSKKPYTEFDDTNPLTVYGRSKRAGENYVKSLHTNISLSEATGYTEKAETIL